LDITYESRWSMKLLFSAVRSTLDEENSFETTTCWRFEHNLWRIHITKLFKI